MSDQPSTILGGSDRPDPQHTAHRDYAMGLLDAFSLLVVSLAKSGAIKPEELADAFSSSADYAEQHISDLRALPLRHLAEQLRSFIDKRDAACFDKTVNLARSAGRLGAELTVAAAQ